MTQNYPLHHHQILESAKTVIERPKHILYHCLLSYSEEAMVSFDQYLISFTSPAVAAKRQIR